MLKPYSLCPLSLESLSFVLKSCLLIKVLGVEVVQKLVLFSVLPFELSDLFFEESQFVSEIGAVGLLDLSSLLIEFFFYLFLVFLLSLRLLYWITYFL